jgi:capsular polysaccharide biosynthesis protein
MPDTLSDSRCKDVICCLPPNVTLRLVSTNTRLRVERFVLPSFLTTRWDFAYPPIEHLAYVRDRLYAANDLPSEPTRRERVYISRAKAHIRRVTNEPAVLAALRPLGFRPYLLEELTFSEQVRLFHDAEIVVAPHGAGLANLLFARRIPVLEFVSRAVNPVYFFLALALGHDYRYLYPVELGAGERLPSPVAGRVYSQARDRDITVDLEALSAVLDEWR